MNYKNLYFVVIVTCSIITIHAKQVSADRLKGWLTLNEIKQNINTTIEKYNGIEAQLKKETNALLQDGIDSADQLADHDPLAALYIYENMKKLTKKTNKTTLDIAAINEKYKQLSDYIDQQFKELSDMRRKHLQFPY